MDRPRVITAFKNIRVLPSGYQVAIVRGGVEFSRHFAGHSGRSHRAAVRFRDRTLRELPPKRLNAIPRRVLAASGLTAPMVGVFRHPGRSMYQVGYRDKEGHARNRSFTWNAKQSEALAFAAAIAFRKKTIAEQSKDGTSRWPDGRKTTSRTTSAAKKKKPRKK